MEPVGSIRAFSYPKDRDLDWLDDGPIRGKQQQQIRLLMALVLISIAS